MTAPTPSAPTRSRPATTSSRSRSASAGPSPTPPTTSRSRCRPTVSSRPSPTRPRPHEVTVKTSKAGASPDLTKAKAFVVGPDLVAWPASALPAGTDPATLRWRLHWSADGGLAVDAEAVTGGSVATLTRDPAGLPASLVAQHPELKGAVALRLDKKTAQAADRDPQGPGRRRDVRLHRQAARRHRRPDRDRARQPVCRQGRVALLRRQLHRWQGRLHPVGADRAVGGAADLAGRLRRPAGECGPARADDAGRRRVVVDRGGRRPRTRATSTR